MEDSAYLLALLFIEGVGPVTQRKILAQLDPETIFTDPHVCAHPSLPLALKDKKQLKEAFRKAQKELEIMEKKGIRWVTYTESHYPRRLKECHDAPLFLFYRGNPQFNPEKALAIVGTRVATSEGRKITEDIVAALSSYRVQIISGLAFGIDITSHKAALANGMETLAVLGHGLHMIYPSQHEKYVKQMIEHQGGICTEFTTQHSLHPGNFPARNRIISGLSDAVLVVETDVKGGAMITAMLAQSYNREVLAIPGRPYTKQAAGCNYLIKKNIAQLVETAQDIVEIMQWEEKVPRQPKLFEGEQTTYSAEENHILSVFASSDKLHVEQIVSETGLSVNQLMSTLLNLELKGKIVSLPGKFYKLV